MEKKEIIQGVKKILEGIDATEIENEQGWWETYTGADFGKDILNKLCDFLDKNI